MKKFLKKIKNKKILFIIPILLLISISVTLAIYYSDTAIVNRFETMNYNVSLEEEFYNDWGTKIVVIKNNDSKSKLLLRISYLEYWEYVDCLDKGIVDVTTCDEEMKLVIPLNNKYNNVDVVVKSWTREFLDDFIYGDDGYYYYKKIFMPNESIKILERIDLNDDLIKDSDDYQKYVNGSYELTFGYEAIQATSKAAQKLWNKVVVINGDNIVWE